MSAAREHLANNRFSSVKGDRNLPLNQRIEHLQEESSILSNSDQAAVEFPCFPPFTENLIKRVVLYFRCFRHAFHFIEEMIYRSVLLLVRDTVVSFLVLRRQWVIRTSEF